MPREEEELVEERLEQLLSRHDPTTMSVAGFLGEQFDLGLARVGFPEGHGGLGVNPLLQDVVTERLAAAGAPDPWELNPIAYGQGASTILHHGTEAHRKRLLRPMFTGEELWCQLFSEPGAGSDLASLATAAVRHGDEWVVNGQKVWSTFAHESRFALLLARTDPSVPKHQGLTYFFLDMRSPGIEVRPLYEMTGEAEFNEVYLTDVRVPDDQRISEIGKGWSVAITTLMNERVSMGGQHSHLADAVELWKEREDRTSPTASVLRDRLAALWIRSEAMQMTNARAAQSSVTGTPGPEGSVGKLAFAGLNKDICNFMVDVLGASGMLYGSYERVRPAIVAPEPPYPQKAFLRSRANSIEAGSSEIMRNILGERVLGLPGDSRFDRELPWNEVPRS